MMVVVETHNCVCTSPSCWQPAYQLSLGGGLLGGEGGHQHGLSVGLYAALQEADGPFEVHAAQTAPEEQSNVHRRWIGIPVVMGGVKQVLKSMCTCVSSDQRNVYGRMSAIVCKHDRLEQACVPNAHAAVWKDGALCMLPRLPPPPLAELEQRLQVHHKLRVGLHKARQQLKVTHCGWCGVPL